MLRRQAKPTHEWSLTYVFFCRGDFLAHANDFREDPTERTWFQLLSSAIAFSLVTLSLHLLAFQLDLFTMAKLLPTTVIIAAFQNEDEADTISTSLAAAVVDKEMPPFLNMAVACKNASGKVKVSEMGNGLGFAWGSVGALVGGLACILLGPAGMAAGAAVGAAVGVAGTKMLVEDSIDKSKIKDMTNALPCGSSGLILVFDALPIDKELWKTVDVQQVRDDMLYALAKDMGDSLRGGTDCAYMYAVTEEGVIATRVALGEDAANIQGLVATEAAIAGGDVTATKDAIVYECAGTDGIEAAYKAGAVTEDGKAALTAAVEE